MVWCRQRSTFLSTGTTEYFSESTSSNAESFEMSEAVASEMEPSRTDERGSSNSVGIGSSKEKARVRRGGRLSGLGGCEKGGGDSRLPMPLRGIPRASGSGTISEELPGTNQKLDLGASCRV